MAFYNFCTVVSSKKLKLLHDHSTTVTSLKNGYHEIKITIG